jgi:hypothetical protein
MGNTAKVDTAAVLVKHRREIQLGSRVRFTLPLSRIVAIRWRLARFQLLRLSL